MHKYHNKKGFSLVEVLLAVATFSLIVTAVLGALIYSRQSIFVAGQYRRANFLAREGIEASRSIADSDFNLLTNGFHGLLVSGNHWVFSGLSDTIDGFTREVQVSEVEPGVKKLVVNVSWPITPSRQGVVSLDLRLSDWRTTTPATPKWQTPVRLASLDLSGATDGLKIATSGNYAYIIRTDGAADFYVVNITNPLSPVVEGSLALNGAPSNLAVGGGYAYVASSDDAQELQVINIANPVAPTLAGSYNATGTANATSVALLGNYVYLTRLSSTAAEIYALNITNPVSPTLASALELGGTANDIVIGDNNLAYLSSGNNNQELQIVNASNPASLSLAGSYNAPGNTDATRVAIVGTTAMITRGNQILSINVINPAATVLLATYNAVGTINDVEVDTAGNFVFLATTSATSELEVMSTSNPSSPVQVGTYNITGNTLINGLSYHSSQDRLYGVLSLDTEELIIWAPY